MIFDSDVLIWFSRRDPQAGRFVNADPDPCVSIITVMELKQGARSKADMKTIMEFLKLFRVLPLSESIGYDAADLIEDFALSNGLRLEDALIAATARDYRDVLATGNTKHFASIPRLDLKLFKRAL